MTIYAHSANKSLPQVQEMYEGKGYADFKRDLAEVMVETLTPIQRRHKELVGSQELKEILVVGARKASQVATVTLKRAKDRLGLLNLIDPTMRTI